MLGKVVIDKITGFTGTVTAKTEYLGGNVIYMVEPKYLVGLYVEPQWFNEKRLYETVPEVSPSEQS